MRAAAIAGSSLPGVPPVALARLRAVDPLDPGVFLDFVPDAMSAAETRVREILGEEAVSAAAAAVGAFLADLLLETPAEEIVRRGGSAPAFARVVRELETHPAKGPDVSRALEAIGRLTEETGR